jgi:hypothetical protein
MAQVEVFGQAFVNPVAPSQQLADLFLGARDRLGARGR